MTGSGDGRSGGPASAGPGERDRAPGLDDPTAWRIDLNADLGEALGAGDDPAPDGTGDGALLGLVTTAHVACGFHAGGPAVMQRTVAAAVAAGVAVGAHPSYPDSEGFGRRSMARSIQQVVEDVLYQVGALDAIARACGTEVRSVKPHGALYHRMAEDEACAAAVAGAVRAFRETVALVVPAGTPAVPVVAAAGVPVVAEAFCDRAYLPDGRLAPRSLPGSLVLDPAAAARRAVALATTGEVAAVDGTVLRLACGTLCVHGDTPGALSIATAVRAALDAAGVVVAAHERR